MKLIWMALVLLFSSAFAADCDAQYNQCITNCCANCGSTLGYDANGDLTCEVGTSSNPNQACMNMCFPCSTDYQGCIESGGTDSSGTDSVSCCGTAVILGLAGGFAFIRKR